MREETSFLLELKDVTIERFSSAGKAVPANHINLTLQKGKILGIVGESGSGKSTLAYALMGLLEPSAHVSGTILFQGQDLLSLSSKEWMTLRGSRIGMIFQNPMTSLDPSFPVGSLLMETLRVHRDLSKKEARDLCLSQLRRVGFSDPEMVMKKYPFELSGGMCQRVMIAMVLLLSPEIIIADEPTTALDVTIQKEIIKLLKQINLEDNRTIIFITHNLGIVASLCDEVAVMYGGSILEKGSVDEIFYQPLHPYTKGLLKAIPQVEYTGKHALIPIEGSPIDLTNMPTGCPFSPRCPLCSELCKEKQPPLKEAKEGHWAACFKTMKEEVISYE